MVPYSMSVVHKTANGPGGQTNGASRLSRTAHVPATGAVQEPQGFLEIKDGGLDLQTM